jgi:hypothetical protein
MSWAQKKMQKVIIFSGWVTSWGIVSSLWDCHLSQYNTFLASPWNNTPVLLCSTHSLESVTETPEPPNMFWNICHSHPVIWAFQRRLHLKGDAYLQLESWNPTSTVPHQHTLEKENPESLCNLIFVSINCLYSPKMVDFGGGTSVSLQPNWTVF